MDHKLIIFTDIGDTIIDEGSEDREVPCGVVLRADCIPGAKETMLALYGQGFTIAMVADGLTESFWSISSRPSPFPRKTVWKNPTGLCFRKPWNGWG